MNLTDAQRAALIAQGGTILRFLASGIGAFLVGFLTRRGIPTKDAIEIGAAVGGIILFFGPIGWAMLVTRTSSKAREVQAAVVSGALPTRPGPNTPKTVTAIIEKAQDATNNPGGQT